MPEKGSIPETRQEITKGGLDNYIYDTMFLWNQVNIGNIQTASTTDIYEHTEGLGRAPTTNALPLTPERSDASPDRWRRAIASTLCSGSSVKMLGNQKQKVRNETEIQVRGMEAGRQR